MRSTLILDSTASGLTVHLVRLMADMFKVSTSEDHVTFSVWPENADTYHDIMKMHVDGHFRPPPEKTWDYAFHCDWWDRLDLFKPRWISTEERIVELSIDRQAASRGSSKMLHENLVQKSRLLSWQVAQLSLMSSTQVKVQCMVAVACLRQCTWRTTLTRI